MNTMAHLSWYSFTLHSSAAFVWLTKSNLYAKKEPLCQQRLFCTHAVSAYPRCLHDLIGVSDEGSGFGFEIGSIDDFKGVFACLEFERLILFLAL